VLVDALDQLPDGLHEDPATSILVRADSAGCTHDVLDAVVEMGTNTLPPEDKSRAFHPGRTASPLFGHYA
jgi:hypothetical protein